MLSWIKFGQASIPRTMAESQKPKEDHEEIYEPVGGAKTGLNPIIFLHAMVCSKEIWADIPQRVADATKRTVYTYDARCHGTKKTEKEFSFEKLVEDLIDYMTKKDIKKAILVGHSMGGKTAISAALQDGGKVEMVFIVDMYVKKIPDTLIERSTKFIKTWADVVQGLKDTPKEEVTSKSVPELYKRLSDILKMEQEIKESEERAYLKSNFVYTTTADGKHDVSYNTDELTKALEKYIADAKEPTGEYNGPAYFLYGTKSPYEVGKEEESIKARFTKAEMIKFEDAPHHLFVHSPDLFVTTLTDRINRASS